MVEEDLWFAIPVTGMLRECKVSRLELQEMELVGGWALTAFTLLAPKPGFLSSWGPTSRGPCVCSHSSQTTGVGGSGEGQCLLTGQVRYTRKWAEGQLVSSFTKTTRGSTVPSTQGCRHPSPVMCTPCLPDARQLWWWWGSGRGVAAWPLGWGDPGEPPQPFSAKLQWPRILCQSLTPSSLLTQFTEKNEGHLPQTLQGPNFLQATREMLRTFQKAWGPWALEARPAKG